MQARRTGENASGNGTKIAPAPSSQEVEQSAEFFVSIDARGYYSGPPKTGVCSAGTAIRLLLQNKDQSCGRGAAGREGYEILSFQDDRESRRRRKPEHHGNSSASRPPKKKRPPAGEVGNALRSAYQRMIDEEIPPEMLDLLGKLG
jgi:hypothetical protein